MNAVFADTFYWIALTNIHDFAHERVKTYARALQRQLICTTEEVLAEYLNYFSGWTSQLRVKATLNVETMRSNASVRILPQTSHSFRAGFELYRARPDKGYSLTDCISRQTMRNESITEVLTNDLHFEQEGFRAVLRESR